MDINTCTDANTYAKQGVGLEGDIDWNKHTVTPMFACNCAKGVHQTWGVRWTCIHVLMHVHNSNLQVWKHRQGLPDLDAHTHTVTQGHPGFHITIQKW